jgi:hypothetical protein
MLWSTRSLDVLFSRPIPSALSPCPSIGASTSYITSSVARKRRSSRLEARRGPSHAHTVASTVLVLEPPTQQLLEDAPGSLQLRMPLILDDVMSQAAPQRPEQLAPSEALSHGPDLQPSLVVSGKRRARRSSVLKANAAEWDASSSDSVHSASGLRLTPEEERTYCQILQVRPHAHCTRP